MVKNPLVNARDPSSNTGSGISSGEGNGNPLQYSCLGNPMDRGTWQAIVPGVAKSRTQLSNSTTKKSKQMWEQKGTNGKLLEC